MLLALAADLVETVESAARIAGLSKTLCLRWVDGVDVGGVRRTFVGDGELEGFKS